MGNDMSVNAESGVVAWHEQRLKEVPREEVRRDRTAVSRFHAQDGACFAPWRRICDRLGICIEVELVLCTKP